MLLAQPSVSYIQQYILHFSAFRDSGVTETPLAFQDIPQPLEHHSHGQWFNHEHGGRNGRKTRRILPTYVSSTGSRKSSWMQLQSNQQLPGYQELGRCLWLRDRQAEQR